MSAAKRNPGLDLLRALAILAVMLFHYPRLAGLGWAKTYGWAGVDLFFVLSGYLIGGQLFEALARGERLDPIRFYLKRAFRILPAYWVVERPGLKLRGRFLGEKRSLFTAKVDIYTSARQV